MITQKYIKTKNNIEIDVTAKSLLDLLRDTRKLKKQTSKTTRIP